MKKLAATLCLVALATAAFAQGTVKFANTGTTLISFGLEGASSFAVTPAAANGFFYALLVAPSGATDRTTFTFAGIYATNTTATSGGRLQGGLGTGVATGAGTWGIGETKSFFVAGWSADLGAAWNPAWLTARPQTGYFGESMIATGMAGGLDTVSGQNIPALSVFLGSTISSGFILTAVPEPTTLALAGLGAAALLIFRRRN